MTQPRTPACSCRSGRRSLTSSLGRRRRLSGLRQEFPTAARSGRRSLRWECCGEFDISQCVVWTMPMSCGFHGYGCSAVPTPAYPGHRRRPPAQRTPLPADKPAGCEASSGRTSARGGLRGGWPQQRWAETAAEGGSWLGCSGIDGVFAAALSIRG